MTEAIEEGKRAYPHSKRYAANPYKLGSSEHVEWDEGYYQAEFDAAYENFTASLEWIVDAAAADKQPDIEREARTALASTHAAFEAQENLIGALTSALVSSRIRFERLGRKFGEETELNGVKVIAAIYEIDTALAQARKG